MRIDSTFDGGNIDVVNFNSSNNVNLKIRNDKSSHYRFWFYFRCIASRQDQTFNIINADQCSYPEAWENYSIVASYDNENWFRIKISYSGDTVSFSLKPEHPIVYFALYIPYSYARHNKLIAKSLSMTNCSLAGSGVSVNGRPIELLNISNATIKRTKKNIWLIARQHPSETMSEWFIEGLLETLLDQSNPISRHLLTTYDFYIAPNMNPDGSIAGHHRTNYNGVDLNRSWLQADFNQSPETAFIITEMEKVGVDIFLDIHGDEEIPYVFAAGSEGCPSYNDTIAKLDASFRYEFNRANPDFCIADGYDRDMPGEADLSIACCQVGEKYNCLSLTIELPFIDNIHLPNPPLGWCTNRSKRLGSSLLTALTKLDI